MLQTRDAYTTESEKRSVSMVASNLANEDEKEQFLYDQEEIYRSRFSGSKAMNLHRSSKSTLTDLGGGVRTPLNSDTPGRSLVGGAKTANYKIAS